MNEALTKIVNNGPSLYSVCFQSSKRCPLLISKDPLVASAMCVFLNQWFAGKEEPYRCFRSNAVIGGRVHGEVQKIRVVDGSRMGSWKGPEEELCVHCVLHCPCPPIELGLHPRIDSMLTPLLAVANDGDQIEEVSFFASLARFREYIKGRPKRMARICHISSWYTERIQFSHVSLASVGSRFLLRPTSWHRVLSHAMLAIEPAEIHETCVPELRIVLDPFAVYRLGMPNFSSVYVVQEWRIDGSCCGLCVTTCIQEAYRILQQKSQYPIKARIITRSHYATYTISGWVPSTPNQVIANQSPRFSSLCSSYDLATIWNENRGIVMFKTTDQVFCAMSAQTYYSHTKFLDNLVFKLQDSDLGSSFETPVLNTIF